MNTIILLHGALGAGSDFNELSLALSEFGLNPRSFSFSGHNQQPFSNKFGIEQFTKELADFMINNKIVKPVLFGYSMGGYVALNYALSGGDQVDKIITLGTKFNWTEETVEREIKMLDPVFLQEKAPAFARSLLARHGSDWRLLVAKTTELMREISQKQFLTSEKLKQITNRVILGLADKDSMVSFEETREVFKSLPSSKMYMLPGSKHPLETVNTELLAFIIKQQVMQP